MTHYRDTLVFVVPFFSVQRRCYTSWSFSPGPFPERCRSYFLLVAFKFGRQNNKAPKIKKNKPTLEFSVIVVSVLGKRRGMRIYLRIRDLSSKVG